MYVSILATSIILTELDADTEYSIRVRAVSESGSGEWGEPKSTFNSECFHCIIPAAIRCACTCGTFLYNYYGNDGPFQCRLKGENYYYLACQPACCSGISVLCMAPAAYL